jgi:nudix-type nucleoside diphosphatase (YffH/AdpP family)
VTATKWHRPHTIGTSRTRDDVQIDRIKHPYDGFFTIEEITAKFRRFDGTWSAPMHRAVFRAADAVTVLPYDPTRDRVMMVEQIRSGPLAHGDPTPWLLEGIAGMIDIGETPQDAARREAIEEAGITLSDLHFVAQYYPTPGGVAQRLYSYIAIADLPDDITGIGGHADEGEDILSHLVPFDLALDRVQSGEIADAPLIISLQWLAANRVRLRDQDQPG